MTIRRKLNGKMWTLRRCYPGKGSYGLTDEQHRVVMVANGITRTEAIATVIHEGAHVALPDLAEPAIERVELVVMKMLKAYGLLAEEED